MIKSMTGFGRGEVSLKNYTVVIEMRTFNHKFFETSFRIPETLSIFEDKIRTCIQKFIKRGRVNLSLTFEKANKGSNRIIVNKELAIKYKHILINLSKALGVKNDIGISQIISFPNVISYEESKENVIRLWPLIEKALNNALLKLDKLRKAEGVALCRDFEKRINEISKALHKIQLRAPIVVEEYKRRLLKKVRELSSRRTIAEARLGEEVAIFARTSDITEEINLMKSHLKNFEATIAKKENVGRILDFIAQELHREANTIGSKTSDFKISQWAIEIKNEIEKIREQVQNVE